MKKRLFAILLCLASLSAAAQDWKVLFSANGGFYEESFELEMFSTYPQGHIRYTVNGNQPTAQSALYTEPLVLDEKLYSKSDIYTIINTIPSQFYLPDSIKHCIVIRAAVFDDRDSCISPVTTQSYFIRALGCDTHGLPVISIAADSLALFDYETGIFIPGVNYDPLNPHLTGNYFMKGREWERLINFEFYKSDNDGLNQPCGMRTHGNQARRQQQKGLKVYAREEYGKNRFNCRFFEETQMNSFKHLILKPYSMLYPYSGIQDYLCNHLARAIGLEAAHSRPVCLFIDGEYWGIYFLQEKMDERYVEDHFNIDTDSCKIVDNWYGMAEHGEPIDEFGNIIEFVDLMNWIDRYNLTKEENYQHLCTLVDIDNFIDYIIFETFVANNDWPANNMRCWKAEGGKWRWMFFDGDAAFNDYSLDHDSQAIPLDVFGNATYQGDYLWPSSTQATLMFRRCLDNDEFVSRFENRLLELCNNELAYENTLQHFSRITAWLYPEIEAQSFRFGNPMHLDYWNWACTLTNDFLSNRVETYLEEWFVYLRLRENWLEPTFCCYPNPFAEEMFVGLKTEQAGSNEIAIYDMTGRKVFSHNLAIERGDRGTIHPDLPAGVYVLKMGDYTQRIVRY